jgi:FkbM family methyltransferase
MRGLSMRRMTGPAVAWAKFRTVVDLIFRTKRIEGPSFRWPLFSLLLRSGSPEGFQGCTTLESRGLKFVINEDGGLGFLSCKYFEPVVFEFMNQFHGGTFVDVGANVGAYVVSLAGNFDHVIAVEPNPRALALLNRNISLNHLENINVVGKAIGSASGHAKLYHNAKLANWSLSLESASFDLTETATLDELLAQIAQVDICLIDVEGYEWEVLRGCQHSLSKIESMIIEVKSQLEPQILHFMESNGFFHEVLEDRGFEKNILFRSRHGDPHTTAGHEGHGQ